MRPGPLEALLDGRGHLEQLHGGSFLYREGAPSAAVYVVVSGRIRIRATVSGVERTVREVSRGELIGTLGVFTGRPRTTTAVALRDSEVRCIPAGELAALMESDAQALWDFGRLCIDNLQHRHSAQAGRYRASLRTVALLPAHPDLPDAAMADMLARELGRRGSARVLDRAAVNAALGEGAAEIRVEQAQASARLAAWLNEQEHRERYLVYRADGDADSAWTRRCLRQADLVLVVARPDRPVSLPPDFSAYLEQPVRAPVECLFLGDHEADAPLTPWSWREACHAEFHHWVRPDDASCCERLVRLLTGEAVGLVLGGGGARGFAHLGLLRAMEERGLGFDLVGGTSIGALIGGLAAIGRSSDEIEEVMRELFLKRNNLNDFVVPRVSLIGARKLRRRVEVLFGRRRIEMLDKPFYCVSTNLTRGESVVHQRGPVAHWIGTSMSVPGIAPPVAFQGDLLVDGAVLNNVPADVMQAWGRGPVIASDVTAAENLDIAGTEAGDRAPTQLKRAGRQPNIFKILFRSATLLSPEQREARAAAADLYLRMPIAGVGMFDWAALDEIVARSTEYSREQLDRWLNEPTDSTEGV